MRVSLKNQFSTLDSRVPEVQSRLAKLQSQIASGKKNIEIADSPEDLIDQKRIESKIRQNDSIFSNLEKTVRELYAVDEELFIIADYVQQTRDMAIGSFLNDARAATTVAETMEGLLADMVKQANQDYNGTFLFGGNKNQFFSDNPDNQTEQNTPFKLIEGESTDDNPSGLRVEFIGNNEVRSIRRDEFTTEEINVLPKDIFGQNSVELFSDMIDMINIIKYDSNGVVREVRNSISKQEYAEVDRIQKKLATHFERLTEAAGKNGGKIQRLEIIMDSIATEQIRLKDYRSLVSDTDVAEASLELKKEEAALQYALQIGSVLSRNTLFDFIR
ncbi:MAG: hypothetical protein Kapaf2KO_17050 [Candidatus Kapaibacteriales bacterium]